MRSFIIKFLYYGLWLGIFYFLLKVAMPYIGPFIAAFIIAFMLKPLINWVARKTRLGRKPVAIALLVLLYAVVGTALTLAIIRAGLAIGQWFANLPAFYVNTIEPVLTEFGNAFEGFAGGLDPALRSFVENASESLSNSLFSLMSSLSTGALNMVSSAASRVPWAVVGVVLCIIASFFFVMDYYKITSFLVRQLPPRGRRLLFVIKDFVVNVLFRFSRAYLLLLSITFVEVAVGLLILQVPSPFLIALITAVVDILPVLGTGTIMIPWAVVCFVTGDYFLGVGIAVLYVVITLVRQFLEPRVVGQQIGLYPLLTLISMFIGGRLFGFWGLFAFPIALTVVIYLNRTGEIHLFNEGEADNAPPPAEALPAGPEPGAES